MSSLMGASCDRKVTPGITELSRLRAHLSEAYYYLFDMLALKQIDGAACYIDVGSSYPGRAEFL